MTLNILGTPYAVEVKKYDEYPDFKRRGIDGCCDALTHKIVICDMRTWPVDDDNNWPDEPEEVHAEHEKRTLRHEIVHAFFNESGLQDCSANYAGPWAHFEEMIDWWAIQGPKVYQAWLEADAV